MASNIHCRHWSNPFVNGRRQDTCAHGIDIRKKVGGPNLGWGTRMPCIHGAFHRPDEAVTCDKREPYTAQEIKESKERMDKAVASFLAGRSPCCSESLIEQGTARFCSKCKEFVARVCPARDDEP